MWKTKKGKQNVWSSSRFTIETLCQCRTESNRVRPIPSSVSFAGAGSIFVEGKWELRNTEGELIDQEIDHVSRQYYRVHHIIDQEVVSYDINPPSSFTLHFKNGFSLTVYDDSEQYESFSIHPDEIYV